MGYINGAFTGANDQNSLYVDIVSFWNKGMYRNRKEKVKR
jgi:hypothetical protein